MLYCLIVFFVIADPIFDYASIVSFLVWTAPRKERSQAESRSGWTMTIENGRATALVPSPVGWTFSGHGKADGQTGELRADVGGAREVRA